MTKTPRKENKHKSIFAQNESVDEDVYSENEEGSHEFSED